VVAGQRSREPGIGRAPLVVVPADGDDHDPVAMP
jgi:hypothetical protein